MRRTTGRLLLAVLGGCALWVALPSVAQAGVVTASEDQIAPNDFDQRVTYRANSGEANTLTLSASSNKLIVTDPAGVTPGSGCVRPNPAVMTRAACNFSAPPVVSLRVELGDGNDRLNPLGGVAFDASIDGGPGNDILNGSDGNDVIRGGRGNDQEFGFAGDDRFRESGSSADGADLISGGAGGFANVDIVDFSGRRHQVKANLHGDAGDGESGENDQIIGDVEGLIGGRAGDRLSGNGRRNEIKGGPGDDRIKGGKASDSIRGGRGKDRISGGPGSDFITGDSGRDRLDGGRGRDDLSGGSSADLIRARDGQADGVACGSGGDHVSVDNKDMVFRSCEHVHRRGIGTAMALASRRADPFGFAAPRGLFEVEFSDIEGVEGRHLELTVGCPVDAGGTCHMHVFVTRHGQTVGDKRVTVGSGRSKDEVEVLTTRSFAQLVGRENFVRAQIVTKSRAGSFRSRRSQAFLVVDPDGTIND
jgi:hemolysin type calcium-binding protein